MKRTCPNPMPWHEVFERLTSYASLYPCVPPSPPKPLILNGWIYSNDVEKIERWEKTLAWAENNGCADLVSAIPVQDSYFVDQPTSYVIGPLGGPMYRTPELDAKNRPGSEQLAKYLYTLSSRWPEVVGRELATITRPIAFTGEKARRLLVLADGAATPPWGGWSRPSKQESERRTFTSFRAAVNKALAPHEVDHIDFATERNAVPGSS